MVELSNRDSSRLISKIKEVSGFTIKPPIELISDTSDFMRIDRGNVLWLEGKEFFVSGNVYEPRFGLEDQPKFWVKSGYDLESGQMLIIKLEFFEAFVAQFGSFHIPCYRSPEKESEVIQRASGDTRFMQGYSLIDDSGNNVRVMEFIHGQTLYHKINDLEIEHEQYYNTMLAPILIKLVSCLEAIDKLHNSDLCHGDIRNDHIIIEDKTGEFRWIDFDLNQDIMFDPYRNYTAFDVWSFGNVLQFVTGMGFNTFHDINANNMFPPDVISKIKPSDASAFHQHRLMNLQKIYPYINKTLNNILMRFSMGAKEYYWTVPELIEDLQKAIPEIPNNGTNPFLQVRAE